MSAEKITIIDDNSMNVSKIPELNKKPYSGRVDINHLFARVRKEQKKENQTNFIFFGLILLLVVVVGIILSF